MIDSVALLISGLATLAGLCGRVRPEVLRSSMGENYSPRNARVTAVVLLLLGVAGLVAILSYHGGPIDFSPV